MCQIVIFSLLSVLIESTVASGYFVILTSNGPVVRGAEITFTAKLYQSDGSEAESNTYRYTWNDNGIQPHNREVKLTSPEDKWTITYPASIYPPGPYMMQVEVSRCIVFYYCYPLTSERHQFHITSQLNGQMNLKQDNTLRPNQYVSNNSMVEQQVALSPQDNLYLKNNATSILTYWFIDCQYYGMTNNFSFPYKYTKPETQHIVEALVVAGFEPITTPAPTTTSTTTTTTTSAKPPNSTSISTTTESVTVVPTSVSTSVLKSLNISSNTIKKVKREVYGSDMMNLNGSTATLNDTFPFVCFNQTNISPDPKKVYGYFSRTMIVKAPVTNISVEGNGWLPRGDVLSLNVTCTGSSSFAYCTKFINGPYNVTGNETCDYPSQGDICKFSISRYYQHSGDYSIIIIVQNDVSKLINRYTVNVYEVTKQPQLSVIVVPVSFSLVAVVLIVFGMAYYIQNRRRFTVEVADFDFGQTYSDMEYKTFQERLRDSITNALTRTTTEQSEPTSWSSSSRKYGSMT